MTSADQLAPIEHWSYTVDTPFRPVPEIVEATLIGPPAPPAMTWTGSTEQVAFRERVLKEHLARSRTRKGPPGRELEPGELAAVASTGISMRRDAAEAAGRLLSAANEALARARRDGHADAARTQSVTANSGYRSSSHQARVWRGNFAGYYNRTARHRVGLVGGPHGVAACRYLIDDFRIPRWVAAPGYSNHQNGIAIDLRQVRVAGAGIRNSSRTEQLDAWRRSWLHGWLVQNAASFEFRPYEREPWHWEYRPGATSRLTPDQEAEEEDGFACEEEDESSGAELDGVTAESGGLGLAEYENPATAEDALAWLDGDDTLEAEEDEEAAADRALDADERPESDSFEASEREASFLAPVLELLELAPEAEDAGLVERLRGLAGFAFGGPLRRGATGPAVAVLQTALSRVGHPVPVTGQFTDDTDRAVRAFQTAHGMCVHGVVGEQTRLGVIREVLRRLGGLAPLPERIVHVARSQAVRWQRGSRWLLETDPGAGQILHEYYRDGVCQTIPAGRLQSAAWHADTNPAGPWSATFVSWVMRTAGAGRDFTYSTAHRTYIAAAKRNRLQRDTSTPFWAYAATEVAPEPGDIVCRTRGAPRPTYTTIDQPGAWIAHCDVVVEPASGGVIEVIGGNVALLGAPGPNPPGLTVRRRTRKVGSDGKLIEPGFFAVVRCRGAAPGL